jgi:hypothetical protein
MSISEARFKPVFNGMTSIAQKVYDAVPIQETWSHTEIQTELTRVGLGRDLNVTRGCLRSLVEAGLIIEPQSNHFIRVPVRVKLKLCSQPEEEQETEMASPSAQTSVKNPTQSALEKLGLLAARVNTAASNLKALSSELETAALEIEEMLAAKDAKMVKLTQLQSLLKDLA